MTQAVVAETEDEDKDVGIFISHAHLRSSLTQRFPAYSTVMDN